MERISNKNSRYYVQNLKEFKGSNLYSKKHSNGIYVVYSYGEHYPLWLYYYGAWYGNNSRYITSKGKNSVSTSRHRSQTIPTKQENIKFVSTLEIMRIINVGLEYEKNLELETKKILKIA